MPLKSDSFVTGWPLIRRLVIFYGAVALASGMAAVFVLAFIARPQEMMLMVAGGVSGIALSKAVRWLNANMRAIAGMLLPAGRHAYWP